MQHCFVRMTRVMDMLLAWIPAAWDLLPLIVISVLTGLLVLLVYRYLSSPAQIKKSKDRVKAHILAIRLYRNEWRVILKSFGLSLGCTLRYFTLNLVPLLVLLPLLAPLFAQLEVRYGLSSFRPGATAEIQATMSGSLEELLPELVPASWYRPVMAPVYVYAHNQAHWRIEMLQPGKHSLEIRTSAGRICKSIHCGDDVARTALSCRRHRGGLLAGLLYPVEEPFGPGDPVLAVRVDYPERKMSVFSLRLHWIWLHLLIVVTVVLALRKRFGIEF